MNIKQIFNPVIGFGLLMIMATTAPAEAMTGSQNNQFRKIDQPLGLKLAITLGGLSLIGGEVWWFLLKKPKTQNAQINQGVQELTITVDGGYEPNAIIVQVNQPVRLNFFRKDTNHCLEEVLLPDFGITTPLPLNQTTSVEFIPHKTGDYAFTCGMRMFRGVITVQSAI